MVAYALGEADGDAALVQLVHVEAEKRAVDIMRDYMSEKQLNLTVNPPLHRYASGTPFAFRPYLRQYSADSFSSKTNNFPFS